MRHSQAARVAHRYTFTFAGIAVSDFSLHMLDFGDWNPSLSTAHSVNLTAYNGNGTVVAQQAINYTTQGVALPVDGGTYGNLTITGDAISASPGQLGNWTWNVSGSGIVKVVLDFGAGFDPAIGFDTLTYTTECVVCQTASTVADFSQVAPGGSVEGVGVVAPNLDIDARGTAVKISEATAPVVYGASPNNTFLNGGIAAGGGFSDATSQAARVAHRYTFTFAGIAVSDFSLHMLDFGDWNPSLSTAHSVNLTAYNGNGTVVAQQAINYTTQGVALPVDGGTYGNLTITGDAISASPGQLGNWTWNVSGSGIVKVVLDFGAGFDPAIGFDTLTMNCSQ